MSSKPVKASKVSNKGKLQAELTAESRSLHIEQHIEAFLDGGGTIEEIPRGVSGRTSTAGPKHISLGNSNKPRS